MKQIIKTVYDFNELTGKARERALMWVSEVVLDFEWWESTYEDAERIGLKLSGFDIGRRNYIEGHFIVSAIECSEAIFREHGKECATYKTALAFDAANDALPELPSEDSPEYGEIERRLCESVDANEADFLDSLLQDYLKMLRDKYEYQTSEPALIEFIEANGYTFDENGKREG